MGGRVVVGGSNVWKVLISMIVLFKRVVLILLLCPSLVVFLEMLWKLMKCINSTVTRL
jgi:hypothetical protein